MGSWSSSPRRWNQATRSTPRIQTIKDGELVDLQQNLSYICEGGILEEVESDGIYHAYYQYTPDGVVMIEKWSRTHIQATGASSGTAKARTVREEAAKAVIDSHKRLELNWNPITEYPMN